MAETFKLPCSSYEELIKLFQAYANTKEGTALSLDEITQATGVPRTIVSKNNGFMVQVGLITEGNKKAATETGRALGRAYALSAHISKKHRGMIEFVGQVRNAADHGADPDENNQVWTISNETARIYPCIIAALIKAIFSRDATGSIEV